MINNEILSFIKDQIAQGTTKDQVKDMLVTQGGWNDKDVEEAFETINFSGTSYPAVLKNAMADVVKTEEKGKNAGGLSMASGAMSGGAFTSASELSKSLSGDAHPTAFPPGLSHMEQPKSMEPSMPSSFFPADIAPRSSAEPRTVPNPRINAEPMKGVSENFRTVNPAGNNAENNPLGGLRARIAAGVGFPPAAEPVSTFQPVIQPAAKPTPSLSPKPPVIAPNSFSTPVISATAPMTQTPNSVSSRQPSSPSGAALSGLSSLSSLGKAPMPSVMSAPIPSGQPQPMAVIKGPMVAMGSHMSPTPAQLAVLQAQKQKGGGRFLLGLLMFLTGLALGGVLMNAYMKGYVHTTALNGMIEKVMDKIGLGTVTPPPAQAPATAPAVPDGGS